MDQDQKAKRLKELTPDQFQVTQESTLILSQESLCFQAKINMMRVAGGLVLPGQSRNWFITVINHTIWKELKLRVQKVIHIWDMSLMMGPVIKEGSDIALTPLL